MADRARATHGAGLARGPALIIGAILAAFGLILFLKAGDTPTDGFPDGSVDGVDFLGFETNGWTAWFTTAAGALLLFGAAQHLLAKTMSLVVGLALGACAIIAAIDGDVLGLAAANFWTELGWGIAAVLLVFNVLSPRVDRDRDTDDDAHRRRRPLMGRRDHDESNAAEEQRPTERAPTNREPVGTTPDDSAPADRSTTRVEPTTRDRNV